jgi:hypothetical protein
LDDCIAFLFSNPGLLDPEDENTMILQNIRKYSPNNMVSHPRRCESSTPPL